MKNKKNVFIALSVSFVVGAMYFSFADKTKDGVFSSVKKDSLQKKKSSMEGAYFGIKAPGEKDEYVGVMSSPEKTESYEKTENNEATYNVTGSFDERRRDLLAIKNQKAKIIELQKKELAIIKRELATDEKRLNELEKKGDHENMAYLENLIAQKKTRMDELQYQ